LHIGCNTDNFQQEDTGYEKAGDAFIQYNIEEVLQSLVVVDASACSFPNNEKMSSKQYHHHSTYPDLNRDLEQGSRTGSIMIVSHEEESQGSDVEDYIP
jgi:hypothetical protein